MECISFSTCHEIFFYFSQPLENVDSHITTGTGLPLPHFTGWKDTFCVCPGQEENAQPGGVSPWESWFLPHCPPPAAKAPQAAAFYWGNVSGVLSARPWDRACLACPQDPAEVPGPPHCRVLFPVHSTQLWEASVALEASAASSLKRKHKKTHAGPNRPFDFEK